MAAPRDKYEKERDREIVKDYYLKGYSFRKIADFVGQVVGNGYTLSFKTVATDVEAILQEWKERRIDDIHTLKIQEIEKINKLENTAWEAWEKSITNYEKTSKKHKDSMKNGTSKELSKTDVITFGNPAYLQLINNCIERRCKILGVDAPEKKELTGKGGKDLVPAITFISAATMTDDQIDKILNDRANN